jgi:hypothetical protein
VIEEALLVWIQKEQQDCTVITDQMLQAQARLYAQTFDNAGQDFKASSSWLSKFKERYMNGTSPLEETSENNETPPEKEEEWRYPNGEQTPLPEEPLQDTSKDQARQHLEAVLSYYTTKNQTSSMSAQLIRLVLEKDF